MAAGKASEAKAEAERQAASVAADVAFRKQLAVFAALVVVIVGVCLSFAR